MVRLTSKDPAERTEVSYKNYFGHMYHKLAAYEDTGFEPDEIKTNLQPVVHGEWKPFYKEYGIKYYVCSNCNITNSSKIDKFCRNCGARMDGDST